MLAQAQTDYERLQLRDQARALGEAAKIFDRRDVQATATALVQRCEREIWRANPAGRRGGDRRSENFKVIPHNFEISDAVMKQIRAAHSAVTDEAFEALVEASIEAAEPLTRAAVKRGLPHVARATGDAEWYTPAAIVEAARAAMGGIDLDPASTAEAQATVRAGRYYTAENDGLAQAWDGRVYLNPPYSISLIARFVAKLLDPGVEQYVALVNNATETKWGSWLLEVSDHVCFVRGRVRFVAPSGEASGRPLQGQMICGRGMARRAFRKHFGGFGPCR